MILVTGANGFVGSCLVQQMEQCGYDLRCAQRKLNKSIDEENIIEVGDIGPTTDWTDALAGVDCVVHLAARVHIMNDTSLDPLAEFRRVNLFGTLNLACQAIEAGVRRIVYLSTIKVNGEETKIDSVFSENDVFIPDDPYALSKYEAEQELLELAKSKLIEVVIIRPPLVYGPGVKGNFLSMIYLLKGIYPLPLKSIINKRNIVGVRNLVDFIITCVEHPNAANEVFLVSDGEEVSTPELLRRVSEALDQHVLLLPVNQKILECTLRVIGRKKLVTRLCGSLRVDSSKANRLLGWLPPFTMDEELKNTAQYYIDPVGL